MIEVRDAGQHHWELEGLGTTWSNASRPYFISSATEGVFLEQVERNAFSDATTGRDSVEFRVQHRADGPVLAATRHGTLRYVDADRGLLQVALLSKADPDASDAVGKARSGAYMGLSVGMIVRDDRWGVASDGVTQLRTIVRASLPEVSIVNRPANPGAQVMVVRQENRSATGDLIEYRAVDALRHAKYSDEEVTALGRKGQALRNPDGSFSFPIADREDLANAIRAVGGRAQKSPPERVRVFIMAHTRALGLRDLVPASWRPDGTVKRFELESLGALRRDLGIPRRTDPDEERWENRRIEDVIRRNRRAEREFLDRRRDY